MTTANLSKSAQSVQDTLQNHGVISKVVELSASTRTANDAAATLGCDVAQIIKSLVFQVQDSDEPILLLVSGSNRVNEIVVAKRIGKNIIKATAEFTRAVTGFAIGGVPPIGHKQNIETYIDEDLLRYEELWAAAGTPHAVFNLDPENLELLTRGKVIAIK